MCMRACAHVCMCMDKGLDRDLGQVSVWQGTWSPVVDMIPGAP